MFLFLIFFSWYLCIDYGPDGTVPRIDTDGLLQREDRQGGMGHYWNRALPADFLLPLPESLPTAAPIISLFSLLPPPPDHWPGAALQHTHEEEEEGREQGLQIFKKFFHSKGITEK